LSSSRRIAVIVTTGEPEQLVDIAERCRESAGSGASIRLFFRDESIPALCRPEVAARLLPEGESGTARFAEVPPALDALRSAGDVRLYACSSSLYIWGVQSSDLIAAMTGARGLIAFLAEDLAGADEVVSS